MTRPEDVRRGDAFLIPPGVFGCVSWRVGERCGVLTQAGQTGVLLSWMVAQYMDALEHLVVAPGRQEAA